MRGRSKFRAAEAIGQLQMQLPPRDQVVGGTELAVVVREGSEAEAWRYAGLKEIMQNACTSGSLRLKLGWERSAKGWRTRVQGGKHGSS